MLSALENVLVLGEPGEDISEFESGGVQDAR